MSSSIIRKYKDLLQNFSYLTLLQIANLLIPLITYPYLIRVLGANTYGLIIYSFAIVSYFSVIINFGFNISSTKEIAENTKDLNRLSAIVSGVYIIKFTIWILLFTCYLLLIYNIEYLHKNYLLFIASFSMTFNELLFHHFFFQGIQKMKYITYLTVMTKTLFLVLIIIFVNNEDNYLLVPIFNGLGAIVSGILSIHFMKKEGLFFIIPRKNQLITQIKNSFVIFSTKLTLILRDKTSVVVLGSIFSPTIVAYYDLAIKLVNIYLSFFQMIPTVILPKLVLIKDKFLSKSVVIVTIIGGIIFFFLIQFIGPNIVQLIGGNKMIESFQYLKYISILALVTSINTLFNYFFIAANKEKIMFKSIIISTVVFFLLLGILYFYKSIWLVVFSLILAGFIELIIKLRFKKHINDFL